MEQSRLRLAYSLLRNLLRYHPKPFFIAVAGASVYAACTVGSSFGVGFVIDDVIIRRYESGTIPWGSFLIASMIVIGIGLLRAVGVVFRRSFAGISHWSTSQTLSQKLIDRIMKQPSAWHQRHMTGDLVARIGVDADTAASVLGPLPFSTSVVLLVALTSIWLVVIDVQLGLLAIGVIPILLFLNLGYQRRIDKHYDAAQHSLGELSEAVHESFDGVLVVKAFGAEDRENQRLADISTRLKDARIRAVNARAIFEALVDGSPSVINILLIAFGAVRVNSGALTIGELSSFIYLFTLLIFPLRIIGYLLSEIPHSASGYKRVMEVLDDPLVVDPQDRMLLVSGANAIEIRDMSYSYAPDAEQVLKNVTLDIPTGQIIAVVGATGSGKTTLLKLISGLLAPTRGTIGTCAPVAIVFQEPFLFSGSIKENIALGSEPSVQTIAEALWVSASDEFVAQLENGIETTIGERGISLSGGQRQRVGLARAVASKRGLLLLDDTTSALDPVTESVVLDRLRSLSTAVTTLIVASRPSTIRMADYVLFIHDQIVDHPTKHDELMSRNENYSGLINSFEHDRDQR